MAELCDCGMHIDLLFKLKTVEKFIHAGTNAKVILLPAVWIMSKCSLISNAYLLRHVQQAQLFVEFFCTLFRRHCAFIPYS